MNALALLQSIHGYLGVLALAALLHPAILLRDGRPLSRGLRWSLGLTLAAVSLAFALGLAIYEPYRASVKRELFFRAPTAGFLFETKEHLAYAVLATALGACGCALIAPRDARALRKLAAALFTAAFVGCAIVVALGTYVASIHRLGG